MFRNDKVRLILGILLAVILSIATIVEFRFGFKLLSEKLLADTDSLALISKSAGTASVSINELNTFPEIEGVYELGDVITLYDYGLKLQLDGKLADRSRDEYGVYKYTEAESNQTRTLTVEAFKDRRSEFIEAYDGYFYTEPYKLLDVYGISYDTSTIQLYQQTYSKFTVPMLYNTATLTYYAFLPTDNNFLVVTAQDPFGLTDDKVTEEFGNPSENPMRKHTYSWYEKTAAENTIAALAGGVDVTSGYNDSNNGTQQGSTNEGSSAAYTSSSDNNIRAQLASYASYAWKRDGTADGTTMTISTTSNAAKESQWSFTETTYSYSYAGLRIQNMSGSRKSSSFTIEAEIINELKTERPYVVVVKFINESDELLGVDVIDMRDSPLGGESFRKFTSTVSSSEVAISEATAVQFEIY